jgi:hypothetical protein
LPTHGESYQAVPAGLAAAIMNQPVMSCVPAYNSNHSGVNSFAHSVPLPMTSFYQQQQQHIQQPHSNNVGMFEHEKMPSAADLCQAFADDVDEQERPGIFALAYERFFMPRPEKENPTAIAAANPPSSWLGW